MCVVLLNMPCDLWCGHVTCGLYESMSCLFVGHVSSYMHTSVIIRLCDLLYDACYVKPCDLFYICMLCS